MIGILDLATAPATQAIQLSKKGLQVITYDVSESAASRAMRNATTL